MPKPSTVARQSHRAVRSRCRIRAEQMFCRSCRRPCRRAPAARDCVRTRLQESWRPRNRWFAGACAQRTGSGAEALLVERAKANQTAARLARAAARSAAWTCAAASRGARTSRRPGSGTSATSTVRVDREAAARARRSGMPRTGRRRRKSSFMRSFMKSRWSSGLTPRHASSGLLALGPGSGAGSFDGAWLSETAYLARGQAWSCAHARDRVPEGRGPGRPASLETRVVTMKVANSLRNDEILRADQLICRATTTGCTSILARQAAAHP